MRISDIIPIVLATVIMVLLTIASFKITRKYYDKEMYDNARLFTVLEIIFAWMSLIGIVSSILLAL